MLLELYAGKLVPMIFLGYFIINPTKTDVRNANYFFQEISFSKISFKETFQVNDKETT